MALKIRTPKTAAVALAVTVAAVSLGTALPSAAAGYTASAGPWSAAVALTGADGQQTLIDVQVAGDGAAFALWRDKAAGATGWDFRTAVRPAGTTTWSAPHTLATGRAENSAAVLAVSADGRAVVSWLDGSGADGSLVALAAGWNPATAAWSAPATLAAWDGLDMSTPRLAAAADGTFTAVWDQGDGYRKYDVRTAALAPGDQAWSAPRTLASTTTGSLWSIDLAVAPGGAATAVWDELNRFTGEHTVSTATRTSARSRWSGASVLPGTDATSSDVQVAMDAKNASTVLWRNGANDLKSATRTAPSGSWSAAQTAVSAINYSDGSEPLAAPNGDVTYVWTGWSPTAGVPIVQTVTRTASTGTWSAPKTLSTGYVNWRVDASIGADGTVQVVWPQVPSIDNGNDHYLEWAVRADGTWSRATALNSTPVVDVPNTDALAGEVAAGPDGRATVLWRKAEYVGSGGYTSQVWSEAQTLLMVKPQITTNAAVSGTARTGSTLTCSAAWNGTNAKAALAWLRDGAVISGATAKTRVLTSADYAHKVSCRVTVSNGAGSVASTSPARKIEVGPALKTTTAPSISGSVKVGHKLTAARGTWSPSATSYTYQWKRNGKTIKGATKSAYAPVKADRGRKITVTITAHRSGWTNGAATTKPVTVR
ncbi:hypothetical protein ACFZAM_15245 [Streptomyces sp. NPDC008079]|uniref:hypothetical protein n=1 Tax=Streptomyces sp. NPDC008079 TaxID=3364806 RepID=UPI0036E43531